MTTPGCDKEFYLNLVNGGAVSRVPSQHRKNRIESGGRYVQPLSSAIWTLIEFRLWQICKTTVECSMEYNLNIGYCLFSSRYVTTTLGWDMEFNWILVIWQICTTTLEYVTQLRNSFITMFQNIGASTAYSTTRNPNPSHYSNWLTILICDRTGKKDRGGGGGDPCSENKNHKYKKEFSYVIGLAKKMGGESFFRKQIS